MYRVSFWQLDKFYMSLLCGILSSMQSALLILRQFAARIEEACVFPSGGDAAAIRMLLWAVVYYVREISRIVKKTEGKRNECRTNTCLNLGAGKSYTYWNVHSMSTQLLLLQYFSSCTKCLFTVWAKEVSNQISDSCKTSKLNHMWLH